MTGPERGFLLLTSHLGNPERKVLTTAQLRVLSQRMRQAAVDDPERDLVPEDLRRLGYGPEMAQRIAALLAQEDLLEHYLRRGAKKGCVCLTWASAGYPAALRAALGDEAPGCLWAKGDLALLEKPKISLVGSRDLNHLNAEFAREAGRQAARQGFCLVSGNARGADRTAQDACLASGGGVISIVADSLEKQPLREKLLYLSEDVFDAEFSSHRALSRNRCIHALGEKVLVAQSGFQQGGTWDGTVKNLRFGWSRVFCFDDGSTAAKMLGQMGAGLIPMDALSDLGGLQNEQQNLFDR